MAKKTLTINVKEKTVVNNTPKPKSSNNYLSSLSIDGIELDKKFDKEILEYSAQIPAETEKIKINAINSNASVDRVSIKKNMCNIYNY